MDEETAVLDAEYVKLPTETLSGPDGELFIEFVGRVPTRQVTNVGERWLSSRHDYDEAVGPLLTDQPLQPGEFDEEDRISGGEFEEAWARALDWEGAAGA